MKDAAQNKVVLQSNCTWKAEPPQRPNTGRCLFEICKKSQNTLGIKTTKKKIGTSRANTVEVGAASSWKGEWGWNDFPYSLMRYIDIHIYLYFFFFFLNMFLLLSPPLKSSLVSAAAVPLPTWQSEA